MWVLDFVLEALFSAVPVNMSLLLDLVIASDRYLELQRRNESFRLAEALYRGK